MTYHLGVDPGKSGGFALIDHRGATIFAYRFESWKAVWKIIKPFRKEIQSCAIEKVASKSGQGVKSVFTFGQNYGGWLAFLEIANISHALIPPNRWQKMLLGSFPSGESKVRSVDFINRKYPHANLKKSDHGISDALCLALYALVLDRRITGRVLPK